MEFSVFEALLATANLLIPLREERAEEAPCLFCLTCSEAIPRDKPKSRHIYVWKSASPFCPVREEEEALLGFKLRAVFHIYSFTMGDIFFCRSVMSTEHVRCSCVGEWLEMTTQLFWFSIWKV